ncbi:MAG TPA: hypothetical protein VGS21_01300 [Acidimicrobiales bacterium]|nr:hypothetical protein [Acidimicrobiales bacterium]
MADVTPIVARKTWRTLEPIHGMIYFAPEAVRHYAEAAVSSRRMGYFASRSAAMGPVPVETVIATFYNFHPALVRRALPAAWDLTTPAAMLQARLAAADEALRRAFGDTVATPDLAEAAELARRAAEAAATLPEGRSLFAGHAALPWPSHEEPHLVLWHAQTLLREFRGDGHVAALLVAGLSGIEALVTHAAAGDVPAEVLRISRAWSEDEWNAAVDGLRSRGLVAAGSSTDLALTDDGRALRDRIEDRTDALAAAAYGPLGDEGCARLRALGRPYSKAVIESGLLSPQLEDIVADD